MIETNDLMTNWYTLGVAIWSMCLWHNGWLIEVAGGSGSKAAKWVGFYIFAMFVITRWMGWSDAGVRSHVIMQCVTGYVILGLFGGVGLWVFTLWAEKWRGFWKAALWIMDVVLLIMCIKLWM